MKESVTLENYKDLKVQDLKAELDSREIAYESGAVKEDLQKMLAKALRKEAKDASPKVEKAEPFDADSVTDEEVASAQYNDPSIIDETDEQRRERVVAMKRAAHDKAFSEMTDEEKTAAGIPTGTFGDIKEGEGQEQAVEGATENRTLEGGEVAKSYPEDRAEEVDESDPEMQDRSVNKQGETVATAATTEEPKVVEPTDLPIVPASVDGVDPNQTHEAEDTVNPKGVANSEQPSVYDNNKVDVYVDGVFTRTYSGEVHGQNWKKLADQFVASTPNAELRQHRTDKDANLQNVREESEETMRQANELVNVDPEPRTIPNPEKDEDEE